MDTSVNINAIEINDCAIIPADNGVTVELTGQFEGEIFETILSCRKRDIQAVYTLLGSNTKK